METEEESKVCPNCKREIPSSNLTIHVVHCSRNIALCTVCKEPVPRAQIQEHHDTMHKLLPCKQCGDNVCGTDLEDHIRDSCAHTIKSCRFCELELPRREIPAHEGYCGVRTEQCPDCKEWVMIKYRQLHLDSNHGFIRLDDDPPPVIKKEVPRPNHLPLRTGNIPILPAFGNPGSSRSADILTGLNDIGPRAVIRSFGDNRNLDAIATSSHGILGFGVVVRNLPQPDIQQSTSNAKPASQRGAIKKRPAPKPPTAEPIRDLPYYSAAQRAQEEEKQRQEQTAYNLSVGLPPVLSAAAKLEKLRKMDALHNRETAEPDYRDRLRGRVWMSPDINPGSVIGTGRTAQEENTDDDFPIQMMVEDSPTRNTARDFPVENRDVDLVDRDEMERRKREFQNLKPMSPQEFMERFNELQLGHHGERHNRGQENQNAGQSNGDGRQRNDPEQRKDRFSEIKSSLRELRRGLNEVTAPYNVNVNANANAPVRAPSPGVLDNAPPNDVSIPCEFCNEAIAVDDLVLHQTGCRPDLAQYRVRSPRVPPPHSPHSPLRRVLPVERFDNEPVIPCEFCTEPLPYHLITEHQERCAREANLLYPD